MAKLCFYLSKKWLKATFLNNRVSSHHFLAISHLFKRQKVIYDHQVVIPKIRPLECYSRQVSANTSQFTPYLMIGYITYSSSVRLLWGLFCINLYFLLVLDDHFLMFNYHVFNLPSNHDPDIYFCSTKLETSWGY